jgi:hypothetical protein
MIFRDKKAASPVPELAAACEQISVEQRLL